MYGADELFLMLDQSWFSMRMTNTVALLVVTSVVVVVLVVVLVVRPQPGGVGLVAALHAFPLAFFSCLHAFLQALPARRSGQADLHALNSVAISCLGDRTSRRYATWRVPGWRARRTGSGRPASGSP